LIVLAGLDENRNTKTTSGLSWLPSFMKSNSRDNSRSQLLLFIEVTMDKEEEA
jgi:hypothetical protein